MIEDDPLFNYCICRSEDSLGMCNIADVKPVMKQLNDAEKPGEIGIAITPDGKMVISGCDHELIEYLKTIGVTVEKGKIDVCG